LVWNPDGDGVGNPDRVGHGDAHHQWNTLQYPHPHGVSDGYAVEDRDLDGIRDRHGVRDRDPDGHGVRDRNPRSIRDSVGHAHQYGLRDPHPHEDNDGQSHLHCQSIQIFLRHVVEYTDSDGIGYSIGHPDLDGVRHFLRVGYADGFFHGNGHPDGNRFLADGDPDPLQHRHTVSHFFLHPLRISFWDSDGHGIRYPHRICLPYEYGHGESHDVAVSNRVSD
jgi:hypothetical protein